MKRFLKRIHCGNKGFTLMELLVVVAIMGVIAAVAVPSLTGLIGHSETQAALAELSAVQTAMDSMMAKEELTTVTAVTVGTDDMSAFPDATYPLSTYLRKSTTNGKYTCTAAGVVSQSDTGY